MKIMKAALFQLPIIYFVIRKKCLAKYFRTGSSYNFKHR